MVEALLKYPKVLALSVLCHLVIIMALVLNFHFFDQSKWVQSDVQLKPIQATVIESKQIEESKQQKNIKKAEQLKDQAKQKKLAKQQKAAEAKQKATIKKKQALDAKRKKEAAQKVANEKIKQQQENQRKQAEAAENKRLAEKKQLAQQTKKQEAEKRRLADQQQQRKEAKLKAQIKAEQSNHRLNSLKDAYMTAIKQKIERNWIRPQESGKIASCEVHVLQGPGGIIVDVAFGVCSGTKAYRASIENAVYKAEPLPKPGDEALFDREIEFIFAPK